MNKTLALATIALIAVVMVMSVAAPAMADHDPGEGKSLDERPQNWKDGKQGERGWNCKAGDPRQPPPGKP